MCLWKICLVPRPFIYLSLCFLATMRWAVCSTLYSPPWCSVITGPETEPRGHGLKPWAQVDFSQVFCHSNKNLTHPTSPQPSWRLLASVQPTWASWCTARVGVLHHTASHTLLDLFGTSNLTAQASHHCVLVKAPNICHSLSKHSCIVLGHAKIEEYQPENTLVAWLPYTFPTSNMLHLCGQLLWLQMSFGGHGKMGSRTPTDTTLHRCSSLLHIMQWGFHRTCAILPFSSSHLWVTSKTYSNRKATQIVVILCF
jgi:hypothetical protein